MAVVLTPIGRVVLKACQGQLVACSRSVKSGKGLVREIHSPADARVLQRAEKQLLQFFGGRRRQFDLPLALKGTPFHQAVWQEMLKIPYGQTMSYKQLAEKAGRPKAARAVGQACNRNPLLIFNPCHRVLASDGGLGGFALGLPTKRLLLNHESPLRG